MAMVKVFHGRGYDIGHDTFLETKRPAYRETLLRLNLRILEDRMFEVDESSVDADGFIKRELMSALKEVSAPR